MIFATLAIWELVMLGVLGVVFLALLGAEQEGIATLALAAAIGLLVWFAWDPVKEFFAQPGAALLTVKWAGIYLVVGLAFAVLKWVLYSRKKAAQYLEDTRTWDDHKIKRMTELDEEINLCGQWLDASPEERKTITLPFRAPNNEDEVKKYRDSVIDRQKELMITTFLTSNNPGSGRQTYGIISVIPQQEDGSPATHVDLTRLGGYVSAWASYWPAYAVLLVLDDFLRAVWDVVTQSLRRVFQAITRWAFKV